VEELIDYCPPTRSACVATCDRCGNHRTSIDFADLVSLVDKAFRRCYEHAPEIPAMAAQDPDLRLLFDNGRGIDEIVFDLVPNAGDDLAELLAAALLESEYVNHHDGDIPFYDRDVGYVEKDSDDFEARLSWVGFVDTMRHSRRFISAGTQDAIQTLLTGIRTYSKGIRHRPFRQMRRTDPNGRMIFRARIANTPEQRLEILQDPETGLSAPPHHLAAAGRMNPIGIPVFYGAFDRGTAIAEVRPTVGDVVITAGFRTTSSLSVLDVSHLKNLHGRLSCYDPDVDEKLAWLQFLRNFDTEISRPVASGRPELDYVHTQALAEFLFEEADPRLDAIVYSSSQTKTGRNVAICYRSSGVEGSMIAVHDIDSKNTVFDSWSEDHEHYFAWRGSDSEQIADALWRERLTEAGTAFAAPSPGLTLRLDRASVRVHRVTGQRLRTTDYETTLDIDIDEDEAPF
jgi:hypothetical protein